MTSLPVRVKKGGGTILLPLATLSVLYHGAKDMNHHYSLFTVIPLKRIIALVSELVWVPFFTRGPLGSFASTGTPGASQGAVTSLWALQVAYHKVECVLKTAHRRWKSGRDGSSISNQVLDQLFFPFPYSPLWPILREVLSSSFFSLL